MASPLDIIKKEDDLNIYIPSTINIAVNLIQAFISNNNPLGLRLAILFSGLKEQLKFKNNTVRFEVDELCRLCNIDRTYLSANLRKMKNTIYTYVDNEGNVGETIPFHTHEYSFDRKYIKIEISTKAKELFTLLKDESINGYQFVPTLSKNLLNFNLKNMNKHTLKMQMLLEMINNYTTNKKKKLSIAELNGYFGTKYTRWIDIDRKILKHVEKDIMTYSSVGFSYEPYIEQSKNGRPKYGGIEILIIDNQNLFNIGQEEQTEITTKYITQKPTSEAIEFGESIDLTANQVMQKFREFQQWELNIGKKRSFLKYLKIGYKNNWNF